MIGYLRGIPIKIMPQVVILDVGGVGYYVNTKENGVRSSGTGPGSSSDEISLFIHTRVREDAINLYGFLTQEELSTFELLLSIHAVGPSLALAILSKFSPNDLVKAVSQNDASLLKIVPGVGAKTAERLLVELKQKTDWIASDLSSNSNIVPVSLRFEIKEALEQLGYTPDEIRFGLQSLPDEGSESDLLKAAIKSITGAKRENRRGIG